jgi:hypothetical protein
MQTDPECAPRNDVPIEYDVVIIDLNAKTDTVTIIPQTPILPSFGN